MSEKNSIRNEVIIENISDKSIKSENESLNIVEKILKESSEDKHRERGGGYLLSNLENKKRESRKNAWCEKEENREDYFEKVNNQNRSDSELDNPLSNKEFSSLLEESLDLISEPIGRKKTSENLKTSEEGSPFIKNRCYVKYCYDRSNKFNRES